MEKEIEYFQSQIQVINTNFYNWLYSGEFLKFQFGPKPQRRSIYWENLESLSHANDGYKHNSIPCNLTDGANLIVQFLKNNEDCKSIRYFVNIYSTFFYQQAERYAVVYEQLGITLKNGKFDWNQFPNLQLIKYWANFFKHPKSSMFLHHPTYHIESFPENPNFLFKGIINSAFVKKYYSGGNHNKELETLLLNQDFKIFFPDLIELTNQLCTEFERIFDIVNSKPENIEKLQKFRKKTL
jgi:hypothetical protein